jgi:uncharacterized membrane protein (UPF0127 family)
VRTGRVVERPSGRAIAHRVERADRWWHRLRGLLGRDRLDEGEGLLLVPCRAVHMMGMRLTLDVALLDRSGRIVAVFEELRPGRAVARHRDAHAALELPAGALRRAALAPGAMLVWEEST